MRFAGARVIKIEAIGGVGVPKTIVDRAIDQVKVCKRSGEKEANSFGRLD